MPYLNFLGMSYQSIDAIQKFLAENVFDYTLSSKKASGRALGTFVEIITFYLLKSWDLEQFIAIERPLPEFANNEITHNVEFTLHSSSPIAECSVSKCKAPITPCKIKMECNEFSSFQNYDFNKSVQLLSVNDVVKNACTIATSQDDFINAYIKNGEIHCCQLKNVPFAMFECKRVGVEEGMKKGPQTIEKAKQGSYVARTVSSLQRIRHLNGKVYGCYLNEEGEYVIDEYYSLLKSIIEKDKLLQNFILTVGVISNHGNWFTSDNMNKELKVLAQSHDWLIFLTDSGLVEFINELLISPQQEYQAVASAFKSSYSQGKKRNVFTKSLIDRKADEAITKYFQNNLNKIEREWFNIITPNDKQIEDLKKELSILSKKRIIEQ